MKVLRLDRIARNVTDLDASIAFHVAALGFAAEAVCESPVLASLLGVRRVRRAQLRRSHQTLELSQCDPPGAPYPAESQSNDMWFQHCALVTDDMQADYARLCGFGFTPISRNGPQLLPGGIVAFKFRDPDGHPLELIAFPHPDLRTRGGIDHSAIAVSDTARSIAFYADLGLTVQSRQVNEGPAQNALDGLDGAVVDVVALCPAEAAPHVELLGYRAPPGRAGLAGPADIAAGRLVFGAGLLLQDPDGHWLMLGR